MTWRPGPETSEEVAAVRRALAQAVDMSGISRRGIDRRVGWTENYLSQILRDAADIKLVHVMEVLRVLRIEPREFFRRTYDLPDKGLLIQDDMQALKATVKQYGERLAVLERQLTQPQS